MIRSVLRFLGDVVLGLVGAVVVLSVLRWIFW
jgi:hypothetical protein